VRSTGALDCRRAPKRMSNEVKGVGWRCFRGPTVAVTISTRGGARAVSRNVSAGRPSSPCASGVLMADPYAPYELEHAAGQGCGSVRANLSGNSSINVGRDCRYGDALPREEVGFRTCPSAGSWSSPTASAQGLSGLRHALACGSLTTAWSARMKYEQYVRGMSTCGAHAER
jgi:hypothetical protein